MVLSGAVEQAVALTYEVTRKKSPVDTVPDRLFTIRGLLEVGDLESAKRVAQGPHAPTYAGRTCGCVFCRIRHVLNGGRIDPTPTVKK